MAYLIFIAVSLTLLVGFFILSSYEMQKGVRVFARERARLDGHVERIEFICSHVDFGAFVREEALRIAHRVAHDVAHVSLQVVRIAERLLTQLVRRLRTEHAVNVTPRADAREFVKTLSDFKGQLQETRPEVPDVME